jgi:DNA polymerase-3 subunit chi
MKKTACIFHDTASSLHDRRVFEIVEEAYGRREKVLIYADTRDRAAEIDRLLWILRQDSFIPHQILDHEQETVSASVAIVASEWTPFKGAVLIADGHCNIEFACGFDLIHEFVYRTSPEMQETCRSRFRAYRDKEIKVEYLKTGVWKGLQS